MFERIYEQREAIFNYAMQETRDFRLFLGEEDNEQISWIIKVIHFLLNYHL